MLKSELVLGQEALNRMASYNSFHSNIVYSTLSHRVGELIMGSVMSDNIVHTDSSRVIIILTLYMDLYKFIGLYIMCSYCFVNIFDTPKVLVSILHN